MQPSRDANDPVSSPKSRTGPLGLFQLLSLSLLVALGFVIRLFCLACKPFWFDEAFSVEVARLDWRNFVHLLWWREANMSLYYVLLRLWLHFAQSPFFIRSLSALIGAATVAAVYWLAVLLYDRRVALIAAALLTFNAYSIRYAQEARSYALFLLLASLSCVFLIRALRDPTRLNQLGHFVFSMLAAYAHLYALLLVVAQWLALGRLSQWINIPSGPVDPGSEWHSQHWDFGRNWRLIGAAVAPLLIFVAKTGAGPIRWIERPRLHDVGAFVEHLAGSDSWPLAIACGVSCIGACSPFGRLLWQRGQNWKVWRCQFLLIWLLFPIALTLVLSFARPVFLARYMIFCLPALLILVAAGLVRLRAGVLLGLALTVVLLLEAGGTAYIYGHDFDNERDASVAAANLIFDHTQSGDAVVFHIAETRIPYEFVRSLRSSQKTASPTDTTQLGPEILFPRHGQGLDYRDFTGKPTAEFLRSAVQGHPRVWLMLMNNGPAEKPDPTTLMLSEVLPQMLPSVERWQFAKVEVRLYRAK